MSWVWFVTAIAAVWFVVWVVVLHGLVRLRRAVLRTARRWAES